MATNEEPPEDPKTLALQASRALLREIDKHEGYGSFMIGAVLLQIDKALASE